MNGVTRPGCITLNGSVMIDGKRYPDERPTLVQRLSRNCSISESVSEIGWADRKGALIL
jgi:hypothetical protein